MSALQLLTLVVYFVLSAFAVWRLSSLLVSEDGPLKMFALLRLLSGAEVVIPKEQLEAEHEKLQKRYSMIDLDDDDGIRPNKGAAVWNVLGLALQCIWCTSLWVAIPFALALREQVMLGVFETFTVWLSLSAVAIKIHRSG